jgi:CheY-like chemotaxis protein
MARILVVEDHLITQRVLSKRLRNDGHVVTTADNGRAALDRLGQQVVDLVISDIAMPEMDGLTFLKQLRADDRFRSLPVIMLTTSVLDQHRTEAADAGANDFLEKPVSSWELRETVNRLLG